MLTRFILFQVQIQIRSPLVEKKFKIVSQKGNLVIEKFFPPFKNEGQKDNDRLNKFANAINIEEYIDHAFSNLTTSATSFNVVKDEFNLERRNTIRNQTQRCPTKKNASDILDHTRKVTQHKMSVNAFKEERKKMLSVLNEDVELKDIKLQERNKERHLTTGNVNMNVECKRVNKFNSLFSLKALKTYKKNLENENLGHIDENLEIERRVSTEEVKLNKEVAESLGKAIFYLNLLKILYT